MSATTTCRTDIPVIDVLDSLHANLFFQLAQRTREGNHHLVMHKNFNIRYFFVAHFFLLHVSRSKKILPQIFILVVKKSTNCFSIHSILKTFAFEKLTVQ